MGSRFEDCSKSYVADGSIAKLFVGKAVVIKDLSRLIAHLKQVLRELQRDVRPAYLRDTRPRAAPWRPDRWD